MYKIVLALFLFGIGIQNSAVAQKYFENVHDSLVRKLASMPQDTNKVKLLNQISSNAQFTNKDDCLNFGLEALKLSDSLNWRKGIINSNISCGLGYLGKKDFVKSEEYYRKALVMLEEQRSDKEIATLYKNIGSVYSAQRIYDKALEYYFNALVANEKLGLQKEMDRGMMNIGTVFANVSSYPDAVEYFAMAQKLSSECGDEFGSAMNWYMLGKANGEIGDYERSLSCLSKSMESWEKVKSNGGVGMVLDLMARVYYNKEDYAKALELGERSLGIHQKLGSKKEMIENLEMLIGVYYKLGNYHKMLDVSNQCLKLIEETKDIKTRARAMTSIVVMYSTLTGYEGKDIGVEKEEAYKKTKYFSGIVLNLADSLNELGLMQKTYQGLAYAEEKQEHYTEAIQYNTLYKQYMDSAFLEKVNIKKSWEHLSQIYQDKKITVETLQRLNDASLQQEVKNGKKKESKYLAEQLKHRTETIKTIDEQILLLKAKEKERMKIDSLQK